MRYPIRMNWKLVAFVWAAFFLGIVVKGLAG